MLILSPFISQSQFAIKYHFQVLLLSFFASKWFSPASQQLLIFSYHCCFQCHFLVSQWGFIWPLLLLLSPHPRSNQLFCSWGIYCQDLCSHFSFLHCYCVHHCFSVLTLSPHAPNHDSSFFLKLREGLSQIVSTAISSLCSGIMVSITTCISSLSQLVCSLIFTIFITEHFLASSLNEAR